MKNLYLFFSLILMLNKSYSQNLLAHYPIDGNANDAFGTLHGTVTGAVLSTNKSNNINSSYSFNGTNNRINLGNSSLIRPTSGLTVSVWFELNSIGIISGRSMVSCTENNGYAIHSLSNNTIEAVVRRNGIYGSVSTSSLPYDNTGWHFAAFTYDGRYLKLYLDGMLIDTDDAGANYPITYTANNTYIGAEPTTGSGLDPNFYYKGKLDDVKIYNGALTDLEIMNEYYNSRPIPNVGLKLWLRSDSGITLNGNHVAQWNDISGNSKHASQTTSIQQPSYNLYSLNGKPVLHFDGMNDIMTTPQINLSSTPQVSVFIVNKANNEGVAFETSNDINLSNNGFSMIDNYNYGPIGISALHKGNAAGPFNNFTSTLRSNSTFHDNKICFISYDKSQSSYLNQIKMRVNGNDISNTNGYGGIHTNNFSNDTIFIGGRGSGSYNLDGDIAEVIVYNRLLTISERNQVENYLNQRYNVSASMAQSKPGSGNAITYDGVNDYLSFPSPNFNAYSIETWVKLLAPTANKNIIVFTNSSGTEIAWSHQIRTNSSGKFSHYVYDGGSNTVIGTTTINPNQWYHVCITAYHNGQAKLYINGIEEGIPQSVGSLWTSGTEFRIGTPTGGGANVLNGSVDEVRVWNTVLTQEQIRERMCRKITPEDSLYSNLVVNLNFDENAGTISYDASPNGRNGTLVNGPLHEVSGASIGNKSSFKYTGNLSTVTLSNTNLGDFTATLNSGTASGIHVYNVFDNPNNTIGIDSLSNNMGYFGVFIPNGISNSYTAKYHYTGNGGFANENFLNLFQRINNADSLWLNSNAALNTDSNTLIVSGQNTEYILVSQPILITYYHDLDGDGYGDANDSLLAFTTPPNYVMNNTDCNDNDSIEHPNQIWYLDLDQDQYGVNVSDTQCTRPPNYFTYSELLAISGDCDDNNPSIYPNYQEFEFSGIGNFISSTIYPSEGDSYTTFNFEVIYKDASGAFPTPTFPRVILDYEGNSIYNNTNDRTIIMIEDDLSDSNTVDGKKYIASINGLPTGTNWKTFIQTNNLGCGSNFGPFNYPDVLTRPDLEIFANDITFSVPHPSISSPLSISAEVHNVSDYLAQNIVVHLTDQYDLNTVYTDITIPNLSPHSSTIVTWNLTTIATPSWHPMEVKVDYMNTINESNELDNVAIRPYINGNYNLPGSIVTTAYASPSVSYIGSSNYITLSGSAFYSGTALPLNDSSVAGATISFTIVETGASFTTYTNSNGNFAYSFPKPLVAGIYHIIGTCTDYTLTGNLSSQFELIVPIIPICELPNLVANIIVSSNDIVQGNSISGNLIVKNLGMTTSTPTILSIAQSGGTPIINTTYNIPSLAQFQSDTIPFTISFDNIGQFSICAYADASYLENECSENNSHCEIINVLPPLPDIVPTSGPEGFKYECEINNISFDLHNYGGVNTGPFNCKIEIKQNGLLIETINHSVANILPIQYSPSNKVSFSIPFNPPTIGNYTFEIFADYPINEVVELNELNNHATYTLTAIACKPDFKFYTCENFNVESLDGNYTEGTNITLKANIVNSGNLTYNGNLTIRFSLSSGLNYDTTLLVNLSPTSSFNISKLIPAPLSATTTLTVIVDPFHLIDELNEVNNSISNNMCWEFKPVPYCVPNVLGNYLVNQTAILSVAVGSYALYDADTLKVKFEVSGPGVSGTLNLGNGTMYNLKQSCLCPLGVTLPITFTFPQIGTYTFTMTVDPDNDFIECDESNNVLAFTVNVTNLPDLRILSHLISPSKLNPEPNENINMSITYENIGASNINDLMKLKVIVNNTPLDSIYPVGGLIHNENNTISIPTSWSSPLVGVHVIRAIIDDDNQVAETNELNNEATRAVVVGESANLYFQVLASNTLSPILNNSMSINSRIGNNGDLNCQADLQLLYVNDILDTIQIAVIPIQIDAHDSQSYSINWIVPDNQTTIIGRIINSSILEYTYDDNQASFKIGEMRIVSRSSPACLSSNTLGSAEAYVIGGIPPYNYIWNNGFNGSILNASPGNYTIVVSDNTGQTATSTVTIPECPGIVMNLKYLIEGYHTSNEAMTEVLINEGQYNFPTDVDTVLIELHHDTIGYPMLSSFKGVLQTNGMMSCYFDSTNLIGTSCYIVVKHRNAIETWSANPISISNGINGILNYDFTSAANKAFGSNQSEVESGVWAFFSGDLNDDDNIDLLDLSNLESDINAFQFGYFASDINGDGNVDLLDIPIVEGNINDFIFSNHP